MPVTTEVIDSISGAMDESIKSQQPEPNTLQRKIEMLEKRVLFLENHLDISMRESVRTVSEPNRISDTLAETPSTGAAASLESKIGEFWLARVGTLVLLLGVAFLVSYPFASVPPAVTTLVAYLLVAGVFALSRIWRVTLQHLSRLLFGGGLVLCYFVTLRLHFLNSTPVLTNQTIALIALTGLLVAFYLLSLKRGSELLTGLTFFLCCATGLISESSHYCQLMLVLTAAAGAFALFRFSWQKSFIVCMILVYVTHLLWMLNNPLLGRPLQIASEHQNSLIYLFVYGALFALPTLFAKENNRSEMFELSLTFVNATGMSVLASLAGFMFHKPHLAIVYVVLAGFLLVFSMLNWGRNQSKYASSINACFGYFGLSVAIFLQFDAPEYFIWLGWQSLLVVSNAVWFRSRLLVVVNSFIYLGIFLAYLQFFESNNFVNLSYAIVALISARLLNWQQQRLELRTEKIRSAYLASAFVIILYGCSHAVPAPYVSLLWLVATLFFFGMSLLLKKVKYRWMAFGTILAVLFRVFLIDMAQLNAGLRIILFLAVGSVLLGLSLLYARHRKNTTVTAATEN